MDTPALLQRIRVLVGKLKPTDPRLHRALAKIAAEPGVTQALIRVMAEGPSLDTHFAAMALSHATGELVRRRLVRDATNAPADRRPAYFGCLSEAEILKVVRAGGPGAEADLVGISGLIALNDPAEFVNVMCDQKPSVTTQVVTQIERVRARFALPAAGILTHLLERNVDAAARTMLHGILGREPGPAAAALLTREQERATNATDRRAIRREQLRQASIGMGTDGAQAAVPTGSAAIAGLDANRVISLFLTEARAGATPLRTSVLLSLDGRAEWLTIAGTDADAGPVAHHQPLSLGMARTLLEALPARTRMSFAPVLQRLEPVPREDPPYPAPAEPLTNEEANAYARDWEVADWPVLFDAAAALTPAFSENPTTLTVELEEASAAAALSASLAKRSHKKILIAGLRHCALILALRGDSRAGAFITEAVAVERTRPTPFLLAKARREVWLAATAIARKSRPVSDPSPAGRT